MKLGTFRGICRLLRGGFHSRSAVGILIKKAGHLPVEQMHGSIVWISEALCIDTPTT